MANCTEIRVLKLPVHAQNALDGATEASLDLPDGFSLRLSKSVQKVSLIDNIEVDGVLDFDIPDARTNDAATADYGTPMTVDNRSRFYEVMVTLSGYATYFTRLQVKGHDESRGVKNVGVLPSADHWSELGKFSIQELDFGGFSMSKSAIIANWGAPAYEGDYHISGTGQRPYHFPLIDYGGWCDQSEPPQDTDVYVKAIAVEDFRPWLSLPYIIQAGACHIGWTVEGVIFDAEWVKRLWVYALRPDYYIASNRGDRITGRRYDRFDVTLDPSQNLKFSDLVKGYASIIIPDGIDIVTPGWLWGITNPRGVALQYRFRFHGEFHNDRALGFTPASFVVEEVEEIAPNDWVFTGEIYSAESLDVTFAPFEKKMVVFDQVVIIPPGKSAAINIPVLPSSDFFVEAGIYFEVTPANESLVDGDIFLVSECVGDYQWLDFLKFFVKMIDGRIEENAITKTITIHPNNRADIYGTVVPPFILDEDPVVDISSKVIVNSIKERPVRPDLKRYTRLQFADSGDAYIDSLNLSEPAHSRTITNGIEYPDSIEPIKMPLIEPTFEGQPVGLATSRNHSPYLPRLWDNTEGRRSFNIGPRIIYAYGEVGQIDPEPFFIDSPDPYFFFDEVPTDPASTPISTFGYGTQLPTWEVTPTPDIKGTVVFGSEQNDLFVTFWLGITQESRGGTDIDLLMMMSMKDYHGYNFRKKFLFQKNGKPITATMQSIRDFAPCTGLSTPVKFFVSPVETECCDLPCGCQFTTCEYYQDMGPNMRQTTLNSLKVESFIVDGIELVTSPISFGDIEIVDIGGMPFVTNLVDTLNSIAAPYFTFSISTRSSPLRGKRFFKIKRLACVPFSILITLDSADCYLYTQDEQMTQFFTPGTWNPFGYGAEEYSEPENCETLTEY